MHLSSGFYFEVLGGSWRKSLEVPGRSWTEVLGESMRVEQM